MKYADVTRFFRGRPTNAYTENKDLAGVRPVPKCKNDVPMKADCYCCCAIFHQSTMPFAGALFLRRETTFTELWEISWTKVLRRTYCLNLNMQTLFFSEKLVSTYISSQRYNNIVITFNFVRSVIPAWRMFKVQRWNQDDAITHYRLRMRGDVRLLQVTLDTIFAAVWRHHSWYHHHWCPSVYMQ